MNLRLSLLASSVTLAALAGCYTGSAVDNNRVPPIEIQSPTDPELETVDDERNPVVSKTGLPCDVAVLLKTSCGECHGGSGNGPDAPRRIATYDDLVADSSHKGKTVAALSLERMTSSDKTMPPTGKLGSDEIAILEGWIEGGMPRGSCGANAAKPDGGSNSTEDAGIPSEPEPVSTCTSGVTAPATVFGPTMRPGRACISCHTAQSGPSFTVAGTVFPSLHEPDNCNGSSGPTEAMKVLIIDATGAMRALPVNAAGNFTAHTALPTPYRAIVVKGNSIREMKSTQTDGDCNNCHSEWGKNGAPGRIMEPR